jgi:hypothetical protein
MYHMIRFSSKKIKYINLATAMKEQNSEMQQGAIPKERLNRDTIGSGGIS